MTIDEIQEKFVADFVKMGDSFGQYSYLIELSGSLGEPDLLLKTDANLVEGCQSKVWLSMLYRNGKIEIKADSDTLILKGVLKILIEMFSERFPEEIINADFNFFEKTKIKETFSSERVKGIGYIIRKIKDFAEEIQSSRGKGQQLPG